MRLRQRPDGFIWVVLIFGVFLAVLKVKLRKAEIIQERSTSLAVRGRAGLAGGSGPHPAGMNHASRMTLTRQR